MCIIENVLVNVLTVAFTAVTVTVAYLMIYYLQRSKHMKNVRRFIKPVNRIIRSDKSIKSVRVSEVTYFNRILTEDEQRIILQKDAKRNLFNGKSVRLDNLTENGDAVLSVVGFFDFMTTNLVIKPSSRSTRTAFSNIYAALFSDTVKEANRLERRIKAAIYGQPRKKFDDILKIKELANIVTVSVLIKDCTGRSLIVRRGKNVAISSGNFAVACTGSVSEEDLYSNENPFIHCAKRELAEEINLECNLNIDSVVISKQKLQPAVLLSGCIDGKFEDLLNVMTSAIDYSEENESLFAVPSEVLPGIVKKYQFTDVAAFQLINNYNSWVLVKPQRIDKYLLK